MSFNRRIGFDYCHNFFTTFRVSFLYWHMVLHLKCIFKILRSNQEFSLMHYFFSTAYSRQLWSNQSSELCRKKFLLLEIESAQRKSCIRDRKWFINKSNFCSFFSHRAQSWNKTKRFFIMNLFIFVIQKEKRIIVSNFN